MSFDGKGWSLKTILNNAREESPIGPKAAMAVEHWTAVAAIFDPKATEDDVRPVLEEMVAEGLLGFDPAVTITTHGGHRLTIAGYWRAG